MSKQRDDHGKVVTRISDGTITRVIITYNLCYGTYAYDPCVFTQCPCTQGSVVEHSSMSSEHVVPVNPGAHVHSYESSLEVHSAPFLHGPEAQWSSNSQLGPVRKKKM